MVSRRWWKETINELRYQTYSGSEAEPADAGPAFFEEVVQTLGRAG